MAYKSVFDPKFKYRSADCTDIRLTFERIRREQRRQQQRAVQAEERSAAVIATITPIANGKR